MDIITTKVVVALFFGLIRFVFGILPIKIKVWLNKEQEIEKNKRKENFIECFIVVLQSFGGGVLFATCFLHMMPEVSYFVTELKKYGVLQRDYPFSQLVISLGFFTIYFAEEVCQWLIARRSKKSKVENLDCKIDCELLEKNVKEIDQKDSNIANGSAFEVMSIDVLANNYKNLEYEEKYFPDNYSTETVVDTIDEAIQTEIDNTVHDNVQNMEANLDLSADINAEIEEFIEDKVKTQQQILRCFLMIVALSLHAIFEGLAIGLQRSIKNIWYLFIAVSIHSATVLYVIGSEIVVSGAAFRTILIHMCMLSATTPFGVVLGLVITLTANMETSAKSLAIVLLEGLSTGTILYITFFETLRREKERTKWRVTRAVFIASGFTLMAILQGFKLGD
ncbi:hypothetical protein RN001_001749 [Aquatica leii]|uniref:Uncharacterized protein n=1 Tax=Aquatica leii TaxID=1421715 RepID=A0AAN7SR05_9COLE|nr:hypothetical protein RN001_001749 [Aquatica leii]